MPYLTDDLDKQGQKNGQNAQDPQQAAQPNTGENGGGAFAGDGGGTNTAQTGTGGQGQPFTNIQDYLRANPTGAQALQQHTQGAADQIKSANSQYDTQATAYKGQLDQNKAGLDAQLKNLNSAYASYRPPQQAGQHDRHMVTGNPGGYEGLYQQASGATEMNPFSYSGGQLPSDYKDLQFGATADKGAAENTMNSAHKYYQSQGISMSPGAGLLQDQFDLSDPGLANSAHDLQTNAATYNANLSGPAISVDGTLTNPNSVNGLNYQNDKNWNGYQNGLTDFNNRKTQYETAANTKGYDANGATGADYSLNDLLGMSNSSPVTDVEGKPHGFPQDKTAAYEQLRAHLLSQYGFGG